MWRQLCNAFKVDRLVMVPKLLSERTSVDQYDTIDEALESCVGPFVFMEPKGDVDMSEFKHPKTATYVFGKAGISNKGRDGLKVRINTPSDTDMFAINAAAIVLADRL